jgi:transcriptional regulator with XRE-family HTH domain
LEADPAALAAGPSLRKGIAMSSIQQLREARGESRQELADAVGVTLDEVSAWETGEAEPTVTRFRALAEHFGVAEHEIELAPPAEL